MAFGRRGLPIGVRLEAIRLRTADVPANIGGDFLALGRANRVIHLVVRFRQVPWVRDQVENRELAESRAVADVVGVPAYRSGVPPTLYPRFVGQLGQKVQIPRVEGMSGGPIFGFSRAPSGGLQYHVVALQSGWLPTSRIIFGCPAPVFGSLVVTYLLLKQGQEMASADGS